MTSETKSVIASAFSGCTILVMMTEVFVLMGCASGRRQECTERLDEFSAVIRTNVDLAELQIWAIAMLQQYDLGQELHEYAPRSMLAVGQTWPWVDIVQVGESHEKVVKVWWRTSYGCRGIIIGSSATQMIISTQPCKRELKPGVVIFCQSGD